VRLLRTSVSLYTDVFKHHKKGRWDNRLAKLCDVMKTHLITQAYGSDERRSAPNRVRSELNAVAEHNEKSADD
jgi:hypothetical protein